MKIYVKCNSHDGYLYIFKHGTGPGTIPKDVAFLREKDLPNGYTAVWLDRFLTSYELKAYDIPSETEINRYLDRLGYCQKGGDVVPCDEVVASGTVEAAKSSKVDILDKYIGNDVWLKVKISEKAYFRRGYTYNEYWIRILDKDGESYIVNKVSAYKEYEGNNTQKSASQSKTYTIDKNAITVIDPIQTTTTDKIFGDVEACGDIKASDTKYFADMVSCSEDTTFNQPEYTKYWVAGYADYYKRGMMDDFSSNNFDEILDAAHDMISQGLTIVIHNTETGQIVEYSPDVWMEAIDDGEYPNEVYSVI